jgi:hypothetical protein
VKIRIVSLLLTAVIFAGMVCMAVPSAHAQTGDATGATTEAATEASTEATTEAATEQSTEPVTEPATEPSTEPVTEPSTEPATEPSTEPEETGFRTSAECLAILKAEEGFCRYPIWDYSQYTVGYGTRCPSDKVD